MLRSTTSMVVGISLGVLVIVPVASAQITKDEAKCFITADKTLDKFTASKVNCIVKCEQLARKGEVPFSQCDPPYSGTTLACIAAPVKGVEAKAVASIVKGCAKDCPECYGNCSASGMPATRVATTEANIDVLVPQVGCEETNDKAKAKCIDTNAKTLAKFVGAKGKCYRKCMSLAFKGVIPVSSCTPPASNPAATGCIAKAEGKATAAINKACFAAPAVAPPCYDGTVLRPNTGAGWVALAEAAVDAGFPNIYCGSPSGAFVD